MWFILILPESTFIRCKKIQTTKASEDEATGQPVFAPRGPTENKQSCHQGPIDFRTKKGPGNLTLLETKYEIRPKKNAGFTFIRFPDDPPKTLCLGSWWSLW